MARYVEKVQGPSGSTSNAIAPRMTEGLVPYKVIPNSWPESPTGARRNTRPLIPQVTVPPVEFCQVTDPPLTLTQVTPEDTVWLES